MAHKKLYILVGGEQMGKTFWAERLAETYAENDKFVLVYNAGRPKDFNSFPKGEILSNGDVEIFGDGVYSMQDLPVEFAGSGVKLFRESDAKIENKFFKNIASYFFDTLFITDDARTVYGNTYRSCHINLFSRKAHTGAKNPRLVHGLEGTDCVQMNHSLDSTTKEAYDYASDIILFKTINRPRLRHIEDEELKRVLMECYDYLKEAKDYTCLHIPIRGANYLQVTDSTYILKENH